MASDETVITKIIIIISIFPKFYQYYSHHRCIQYLCLLALILTTFCCDGTHEV